MMMKDERNLKKQVVVMKLCFCGDIEVIDRFEGMSCGS